MKNILIKALTATAILTSSTMTYAQTIFSRPFETVHGTAPFSKIDDSQWMPAIDAGIAQAKAEVEAIAALKAEPDFANTIEALENTGSALDRVLNVFYPLMSADASDAMMEIDMEASAKLSDYSTWLILNEPLWKRVKAVYDKRDSLGLDKEQSMLLQKTYDSFALNGANLQGEEREKFKKLSAELSQLTTSFGQNVLKELNTYEIYLTKDDLAGLPESSVTEAAEAAEAKGRKGEYLFTLDQPVYTAFLKYSSRPDLREKMYRLYTGRNTKGEYSNIDNIRRIAQVRYELARLLGAKNYAEHSLRRTMAQNPEAVYNLLNSLREAYRPALDAELKELAEFASRYEGKPVKINPWDYSYYSNKLKADKYSFDEEALRPYFELDNVINGVFGLATKLYGLRFTKNDSIEVYHPDVKAFDVTDSDGSFIGVLYTDFFPRSTKRPGAWMTNFKEEWIEADGTSSRPQVTIVMNFTRPTADKPSLLTPYEVETFLHEFGHALHGLLAATKYKSLSGTNVYRDFVELPSQFNENYLTEKEFLDGFARHYQTGELIPTELVDRLVKSSQYGAAYQCMRQLNFGYIDMAWHTVTEPVADPVAFENAALEPAKIFDAVEGSMISPQFSHIFSGGYAAGYYSYKWAEVLDADAFAYFKEHGIFDKSTADSFRNNVLSRGGTENPADLYRRFRGQDPDIEALLVRDGIHKSDEAKIARPRKD